MNVLLSTPFIEPEAGGPAALVDGLKTGLRENGHEITVLANQDRSALPVWKYRPPAGDTLVHNFGLWAPINHEAAVLAGRHGLAQVWAPMGMLDPWALRHKAFKKRLAWWGYQRRDLQRCACLHATAEAEVRYLRASGLSQPVAVIPCGVQIPKPLDQGRTFETGPLRLLFLSRIHPVKGLLTWIEASRSLRAMEWHATIAGPDEGGYRRTVEAAIASAGLADRFTLTGPVYGGQAKAALFASADVFVLPSHSENFGIVIAEALAHGLPVITTTATPWESLIREGAGWWVPPTEEGIAEALSQALSCDRAHLLTLGARGRTLVAREYAWSAIINKHLALYAWMLGQGPKPDFVKE